jgi:hypothetical protein
MPGVTPPLVQKQDRAGLANQCLHAKNFSTSSWLLRDPIPAARLSSPLSSRRNAANALSRKRSSYSYQLHPYGTSVIFENGDPDCPVYLSR